MQWLDLRLFRITEYPLRSVLNPLEASQSSLIDIGHVTLGAARVGISVAVNDPEDFPYTFELRWR